MIYNSSFLQLRGNARQNFFVVHGGELIAEDGKDHVAGLADASRLRTHRLVYPAADAIADHSGFVHLAAHHDRHTIRLAPRISDVF